MSRAEAVAAFLKESGWLGAVRAPLAGDASARRYERLALNGRTAVLMDLPPESGLDLQPFVAVTGWLRGHGLSAPAILEADTGNGLLLLEDLGDDLLARLCEAAPARQAALYAAAIDLLADLHRLPPPGAAGGWAPPPYDMATLLREVRLVDQWYLPAACGRATAPDVAAEYAGLAAEALAPLLAQPTVAVYRDYHAENLLWLPDRRGPARIGLLDYQDMLVGHAAYDVVSLLEDARRDIDPWLRAAMLARYQARRGLEPEAFAEAAHLLSAQRNLKILGLFTRLCRRDGKPRYLGYLPRVWAYLGEDLSHPSLRALADWVARHLPAPDAAVRARIAGAG